MLGGGAELRLGLESVALGDFMEGGDVRHVVVECFSQSCKVLLQWAAIPRHDDGSRAVHHHVVLVLPFRLQHIILVGCLEAGTH